MIIPPDEFPADLTGAAAAAWFPGHLKYQARSIFLRRGGELAAMAIVLARRNPTTGLSFAKPQPIPVVLAGYTDEAGKNAAAAAVRKLARKASAAGVGMMSEAWAAAALTDREYEDYLRSGVGKLDQHPKRVEVVMVSWQHEAGSIGGAMAEIVRLGAKPTLGEWRDIPVEGGRFADLLPHEDS